ncbi:alkene reductase [Modestobacter italicus]|uniref:alkene reductase n=1 Tax=Modestobacter italicus (strain DSM 44449 / CECT 9708 / BC 501) TaxID=2732864 RepID=UPI001C937F63|nr:alkene reductase [Modestobacter italicus]
MSTLHDPLSLPAFTAPNRVFMAPMTRMRADQPGDTATELMAEYYAQRAGAGLIVTEGTQISPEGKGYFATPGIYSAEQVVAWHRVTDAVHGAGGKIAAQLWHVGRVTHPDLQNGGPGVSASALPFDGSTTIADIDGNLVSAPCPTPRELRTEELPRIVEDYRRATRNARDAAFDMVEIHGANGYLLQQFMSSSSNLRTDEYGGSLENRARFPLEVVDAVVDAWDAAHVGVRISPLIKFGGLDDADGLEMGLYIAERLNERNIGYLHLSEPDWAEGPVLDDDFRVKLREAFSGVIIAAGGYDAAKAERVLGSGWADAIAFGKSFIANPDLPTRLAIGAGLNPLRPELIYGGGRAGYTDYPTLERAA